jgi:hypothetical protein
MSFAVNHNLDREFGYYRYDRSLVPVTSHLESHLNVDDFLFIYATPKLRCVC